MNMKDAEQGDVLWEVRS
jgi:retinal rod rhodopsin-sensitive cGMP 3',5'-cyclic phosphodiesterase subunit delta